MSVVDPQLAALSLVLMNAINANIGNEFGEQPAIKQAYGFPVEPGVVIQRAPDFALPCLSVYRLRARAHRRTMHKVERQVTFAIEFLRSAPAADAMDDSRNELSLFWEAACDALIDGKCMQQGDSAVLAAAGFTWVDVESFDAVIRFKPDGEQNLPLLAGQFVANHRDVPDLSALQTLLSLDAKYVLQASGDDPSTPLVTVIENAAATRARVVPLVENITTLS